MDRVKQANPFAKRDSHSKQSVTTYKVLTIVTWLLAVIASVYYSVAKPDEGRGGKDTIWGQNRSHHTAFTLNSIIAGIYWIVLFILQLGYVAHLFSGDVDKVNAACAVGSHFIVNNVFHFFTVLLFVRAHFAWAELFIILNFVNLSALYFRHNRYARFIHAPVVSGPLAWTFVAVYWNGAIMVHHPSSLVARIFGNVFIWSILAYGLFFVVFYKDYTMGFNLSVLSAAIGVGQFFRQVVAFQWIFAFTIMSVLFIATVLVAVPAVTGSDDDGVQRSQLTDAERAPLIADSAAPAAIHTT